MSFRNLCCVVFLSFVSLYVEAAKPIPELVTQNGRHALMVDGAPWLILGAQTNNSSNYPAALKEVWPVVEQVHANTVEINVAWEQIEPREGEFDFSYIDYLLKDARKHNVRLILLWFATWKNNAPHYAPAWVKLDDARFPRVTLKDGSTLNSLSPVHRSTLEADKKAFVAMMQHLKKVDKQRTVILVQVQNEVGTYGAARDYSEAAQALFDAAVPEALVSGLEREPGTWSEVFGEDADEFFHAWHIARYCDEIAEAGKAAYPLPMNVNVALRNPFNPGKPGQYSSGGATDNVIPVWKIAAPHIDMISPDIYFRDYRTVKRVLELYAREDNPLFVAEIGNDQPYARYLFETLGHQGIGFAPFGMDTTGYTNYPLGAPGYTEAEFEVFAEVYRVIAPWAREWARLSFEGKVWGVAEPADTFEMDEQIWNAKHTEKDAASVAKDYTQRLDLGRWDAEVTYGRPMFWVAPPQGNFPAKGGALIAQLSENTFLVSGYHSRVTFLPSAEIEGERTMTVRVEEGYFDEDHNWIMERVWNGDQTDWGLNFDGKPHLLKVQMATY